MASQRDELLLQVRNVVSGQADLLALQAQFVGLLRTAEKVQAQQAATALRQESALNRMATGAGAASRGVATLSRDLGALAPRTALFNQLFERGADVMQGFVEQLGGVRGILQQGFDVERSTAQFEILFGDAKKAREEMEFLFQFARDTDFTLPDAITAAKQLEVLNFSTRKYLGSLGEIAATLDIPLTQAVSALQTAGRGQIRQLQKMVPDLQIILRDLGVKSIAEVQQSTEKQGQFLEAVLKSIHQRVGGATERLHDTTLGRIGDIGDAWVYLRQRIFNAGLGEAIRDVIDRVLGKLDELERSGAIDRFAKKAGEALTSVASAAEKIIKFGIDHPDAIKTALGIGGLATIAAAIVHVLTLFDKLKAVLVLHPDVLFFGAIAAAAIADGLLINQVRLQIQGALEDLGEVQKEQAAAEAHRLGGEAVGTKIPVFATGRTREGAKEFTTQVPTVEGIDVTAERQTPEEKKHRVLVDEEAAKKAFARELQLAQARVKLVSDTESEITKTVREAIAARLEADGTSGTKRIEVARQIAEEELSRLRSDGAVRLKLEHDIEVTAAQDRAHVRSAGGPAGVQRALLAEINAREAQQKRVLALEIEQGTAEVAARRLVEQDLRDVRKQALEQNRKEQVDAFLDDVRFERQIQGQTGAQYVEYLEQRLNMLRDSLRAAQALAAAQRITVGVDLRPPEPIDVSAIIAKIASGEKEQDEARNKTRLEERQTAARFAGIERDAAHVTTEMYLDNLERRRNAMREGTSEYLALTHRMEDATELLHQEMSKAAIAAERLRDLGVPQGTAEKAARSGVTEEDVRRRMAKSPGVDAEQITNEAITAQAIKDMNAELATTPDALATAQEAMITYFATIAGLSGKTWAEMTDEQRKAFEALSTWARVGFAAASGFAHGYVSKVGEEFKKLVTTGKTSQGVLTAIVLESFKSMAVGALQQIAKEDEIRAAHNAALALQALGQGLLGHPGAFAAAAHFFAAAAKFGLIAGVASGAASAIQGEGQQQEKDQGELADAGQSDRGERRVKITAADRNITQNFYLSITYQGGLNLFGPEAPRALVNEMIPALQEAIDNKQLHF